MESTIEWIDVNDRLPSIRHNVLCAIKETYDGECYVDIGKRTSVLYVDDLNPRLRVEFGYEDSDGFHKHNEVKYWAEIPEYPNKQSNE